MTSLRALREQRGLSQRELAQRLRCTQSMVGRWELKPANPNYNQPSLKWATTLAREFGVPVSVFRPTPNPPPPPKPRKIARQMRDEPAAEDNHASIDLRGDSLIIKTNHPALKKKMMALFNEHMLSNGGLDADHDGGATSEKTEPT